MPTMFGLEDSAQRIPDARRQNLILPIEKLYEADEYWLYPFRPRDCVAPWPRRR